MKVIKEAGSIMILLLLSACVERYYPEGDEVFSGTLVINAQISSIPGVQTIQISRSSGMLYPEFMPESSCLVELESLPGDQLSFSESTPGFYSAEVPPGFMNYGEQYMLRVVTSDAISISLITPL